MTDMLEKCARAILDSEDPAGGGTLRELIGAMNSVSGGLGLGELNAERLGLYLSRAVLGEVADWLAHEARWREREIGAFDEYDDWGKFVRHHPARVERYREYRRPNQYAAMLRAAMERADA